MDLSDTTWAHLERRLESELRGRAESEGLSRQRATSYHDLSHRPSPHHLRGDQQDSSDGELEEDVDAGQLGDMDLEEQFHIELDDLTSSDLTHPTATDQTAMSLRKLRKKLQHICRLEQLEAETDTRDAAVLNESQLHKVASKHLILLQLDDLGEDGQAIYLEMQGYISSDAKPPVAALANTEQPSVVLGIHGDALAICTDTGAEAQANSDFVQQQESGHVHQGGLESLVHHACCVHQGGLEDGVENEDGEVRQVTQVQEEVLDGMHVLARKGVHVSDDEHLPKPKPTKKKGRPHDNQPTRLGSSPAGVAGQVGDSVSISKTPPRAWAAAGALAAVVQAALPTLDQIQERECKEERAKKKATPALLGPSPTTLPSSASWPAINAPSAPGQLKKGYIYLLSIHLHIYIYVRMYTHVRIVICVTESTVSTNIFLYICLYVHIYIHTYTHIYVYHEHICMYIHIYICVYVYKYIWLCVYIYTYVYLYMYICIHIFMYIYDIYMHTNINTCKRTYKHGFLCIHPYVHVY